MLRRYAVMHANQDTRTESAIALTYNAADRLPVEVETTTPVVVA